jgi:FAD synthase
MMLCTFKTAASIYKVDIIRCAVKICLNIWGGEDYRLGYRASNDVSLIQTFRHHQNMKVKIVSTAISTVP